MLAHVESNAFDSCQIGWMSFGRWTILDTYWKLLSVKNPAALQFLTHTDALGTFTIPRSKALKSFVLPIHPLNGTHTQSMSQDPLVDAYL
jgi:hypothetical protein